MTPCFWPSASTQRVPQQQTGALACVETPAKIGLPLRAHAMHDREGDVLLRGEEIVNRRPREPRSQGESFHAGPLHTVLLEFDQSRVEDLVAGAVPAVGFNGEQSPSGFVANCVELGAPLMIVGRTSGGKYHEPRAAILSAT